MQTYWFSNIFLKSPELDQTNFDPIVTIRGEEKEAAYDDSSKSHHTTY